MNMTKRPVEKYDFKAFGQAIKNARKERKESRKKVSDEMYISPRYLANIENNGQHPSLQIFFELMQRYNISVDQFLLTAPSGKTPIGGSLTRSLTIWVIQAYGLWAQQAEEIDQRSKKRQIRCVRQNWIGFRKRCNLFEIAAFFFCKKPSFFLFSVL